MIIEPPKTIEDFKHVRASILELMGNPWCDHLMFMSLVGKRDAADKKIEELQAKNTQS